MAREQHKPFPGPYDPGVRTANTMNYQRDDYYRCHDYSDEAKWTPPFIPSPNGTSSTEKSFSGVTITQLENLIKLLLKL